MLGKTDQKVNRFIRWIDEKPLWWIGFLMAFLVALPFLALGEGSVFEIHDQMDESILNYILTAKHFGEDYIPELLNGVTASSMEPAAILFVPLFRIFSDFSAFVIMYFLMFLGGFMGMYLVMKELTGSSILSVLSAGLFCMLPLFQIYGLTEMGIPLVLYAGLCLIEEKKKISAYTMIAIFGLTSHLVCTGYAVLGFCVLTMIALKIMKRNCKWFCLGFAELLLIYVLVNIRLITEMLFGKGGYVSHREEIVNSAIPFDKAVIDIFLNGHYHAQSCHLHLIIPITLLLVVFGVAYKWLGKNAKKQYLLALGNMMIIVLIALFYGFCKTEPVIHWKNEQTGFLRSFQMDRFYWLYPALWYLEIGLVFSIPWNHVKARQDLGKAKTLQKNLVWLLLCIAVIIYPTANYVLHQSVFYRNVNQYNNGSQVTSYISWESYYAKDVMGRIDAAIGKDKSSYKIAHLGMNTAPALVYGFYTIDGYSNNYPLEYKHQFRKIIEKELEKAPDYANYFDHWGNRCYLINSVSGSNWNLHKGNSTKYEGLEFDMEQMKALGCEYLFSAGEILDPDRMGLEFMGYFESDKSAWGIWLYALR